MCLSQQAAQEELDVFKAQSHSRAAEREGRGPDDDDDIVSCPVSYDFHGGECWSRRSLSLGRAQLSSAAQS